MNENKQAFVEALGTILATFSREEIVRMDYDKDSDGFEAVTIRYGNGYSRTVNVTGDSCIAIMHDVYRALI